MLYRLACTGTCMLVSYTRRGGELPPLVILATYNISDESRTIRVTSKWLDLREGNFLGGLPPDSCFKEVQPNLM